MRRFSLLRVAALASLVPLVQSLTCSAGLALSGYPYCANSCFSICDKYCSAQDIGTDIYCPCRHSDYLKEIAACIQKVCNPTDFSTVALSTATNCLQVGIDVTNDFAISSIAPSQSTSTTTAAASSTAPPKETKPAEDHKSSTPIGAIVGGAVGGFAVLAITAGAIFWVLRRRKNKDDLEPPKETASAEAMYAKPPIAGESEGKPQLVQNVEFQGVYSPQQPPPPPMYQTAELDPTSVAQPAAQEMDGREIPRPVYEMHTQAR